MTITLMRTAGALLSAFALCSCAITASSPSKSIAASAICTEPAVGSNTLAHSPCISTTLGKRSYSQADLQKTGKTTAGDALVLLDPAINVNH